MALGTPLGEYYVRLERGRDRPSPQVIDALARALQLDVAPRRSAFRCPPGAGDARAAATRSRAGHDRHTDALRQAAADLAHHLR